MSFINLFTFLCGIIHIHMDCSWFCSPSPILLLPVQSVSIISLILAMSLFWVQLLHQCSIYYCLKLLKCILIWRCASFGQFALVRCLTASLFIWHDSIVCNISTQTNPRYRQKIHFGQQLASTATNNIATCLNYHIYLNKDTTT